MRSIVIEPGKEPEIRDIDDSLESLQSLVGGWIEAAPVPIEGVSMFINEEGKIKDLPFNLYATQWVGPVLLPGDRIVGTAVILGFDPDTGKNADLEQDVVEMFVQADSLLREPDRSLPGRGRDGRTWHYEWDLFDTDPDDIDREGGKMIADLSCFHDKERKEYRSMITVIERVKSGSGYTVEKWSSNTPMKQFNRTPVARYSRKALEEYAAQSLQDLRGWHPLDLAPFFPTKEGDA